MKINDGFKKTRYFSEFKVGIGLLKVCLSESKGINFVCAIWSTQKFFIISKYFFIDKKSFSIYTLFLPDPNRIFPVNRLLFVKNVYFDFNILFSSGR